MREIKQIVVHCADTYASMDIGAEEIRKWHVEDNGWSDIGYHYVIRRNGAIEHGRPLEKSGAHVRGHNKHSIGICLVGGKPDFNFTLPQILSLKSLLNELTGAYLNAVVCGHRDLDDSKTCPNFDVNQLYTEYSL